ncbi:hypothetical protein AMTRI_Chr13g123550 [Amborella trichopoda]
MVVLKAGSRPPWVGLGAAVWVEIAAGNAFTFPLYSHSLKSVLGYNQQQLTLLGVANDIGENAGIIPGMALNKFPPWSVLMTGTIACFLGYGVLWLAVSQTVPSLPYWLLWLASCIATNSSAWFGTSALVTNMRNFPLSRGAVAGILKGYVGLSAAVYTEIYSGVLNNSSEKLLLVLTLGIPALCILVMYFVRPCTPAAGDDSSEHGHFLFTQIASVLLGIYLLTTTIINDVLNVNATISKVFLGVMVLLLLAPLAVPLKMTLYPNRVKRSSGILSPAQEPFISGSNTGQRETSVAEESTSSNNLEESEPTLHVSLSTRNILDDEEIVDVNILLAEGEGAVKKKKRPKRGEDFKFHEALIKADFWLLFVVYFLGSGSGITVLNNLAQIGIAAGVEDTTLLLSLFSFCNFIGRLGGGMVSEHFVKSKMTPRPLWMTLTQIIMAFSYLMYASALPGTLYAATALLGICYGVQFSIMVPTSSELFGLKHFGVIYAFMCLGNPLGALIFSGGLAGYVYDKEAAKQIGGFLLGSSSSSCLGPNCFRLTFFVLSGVCFLGSFLSVILTLRLRPVYQMLYSGGSFRIPRNSDR